MTTGDGLLRHLLPDVRVGVAEALGHGPDDGLLSEEEPLAAGASPTRRRELAAGRRAARDAMSRVGLAGGAVLAGPRGEPLWGDDLVGSITHCDAYVAAAVARRRDVLAMGIDAEPDLPLPDGLLTTIATSAEADVVAALSAAHPDLAWDRLLFCLKEVTFKTWYPVDQRWLDFADIEVVSATADGTFRTHVLPGHGGPSRIADGRWGRDGGIVAAAASVLATDQAEVAAPPAETARTGHDGTIVVP